MHHIGLPPSHGSWSFFMHMWPCHKFDRDTPILFCSWGRAHNHTWWSLRFFRFYCYGCQVPCFAWANTCFYDAISLVIMMMSGCCAYSIWYSHFGRHRHCWLDSCRSCFMSCFFLRNGYDDCNSRKNCVILWLTPNLIPLVVKIFECLH
jgi:hypothetical protein